jgi:CelD/BcsL family acetyltransferase involved in cellulose biosynthesis
VTHEVHDSIAPLAEEWEDLADRVRAKPWRRAGWFDAWWRAFGNGTLHVVAVRDGGRLAGVVPMVRTRTGLEAAANWHTPDFGLLAESDDARRELAAALFESRPTRLSFSVFAIEDGLAELKEAARGPIIVQTQHESPFVPIQGTHEDFVATRPGKKRRKNIDRRKRNLVEQSGDVTTDVQDGTERLDELLAEGFEVEGSGWKVEQGTAIASRPDTLAFYTDLARWAAPRGLLRLVFLRVGGTAVAFEYTLTDGRSLYDVKGGYRTEYHDVSPGFLIADALIGYAFAEGLETFELLGAAEPFKMEWTDQTRERVRVQAFARSPAGLVSYAAQAYGRPLAKRVLRR